MFRRYRKNQDHSTALSSSQTRDEDKAIATNLRELGLVGSRPSKSSSRRPRTGTDSKPFTEGYSAKTKSLRGQDSISSAGSVRSGVSNTSRRVGSIDNNVMATNADRSRSRRERTFVGSECAVCEEPLEHTLRGERILQFSCSHVSHEACFYEFIREFESQYCPTCDAPLHLDTSRGGNVIDIGRLPAKESKITC